MDDRDMSAPHRNAVAGIIFAASVLAASFVFAHGAQAQEAVKIAVAQRGNWDTAVSEIGQRAGIFKKHGLTLEISYAQDVGDMQRAVLLGEAEIGVGAGVAGVLHAYAKGAPVRVIGAAASGAGNLFWYVKADSPIRTLKDAAGKTIAYSATGSSTHRIVTALLKHYGLKAKAVATGDPPGTLTQVMAGEIDVGWAAPPFGLDQLEQGQIRIVATGNDVEAFRSRTMRLLITTQRVLDRRKAAIERYMRAYRETVDYMYANSQALKVYSSWLDIPEAKVKRMRDDFFPRDALEPDRILGLDTAGPDGAAPKSNLHALTKAQLTGLVRIPAR